MEKKDQIIEKYKELVLIKDNQIKFLKEQSSYNGELSYFEICERIRQIESSIEQLAAEVEKESLNVLQMTHKSVLIEQLIPSQKDGKSAEEILSYERTDQCPNFNTCEKCGMVYYHNKSYHLASEKLFCPDCSQPEERDKEKQLKNILIDLEIGKLDKYASFDLITTLYARSRSEQRQVTDEEISDEASRQTSLYLKARNNPTSDLHKRFKAMVAWYLKQLTGK